MRFPAEPAVSLRDVHRTYGRGPAAVRARPTAGTVRLAGADLAELSETQLTKLRRARVGFVFQAFNRSRR